jgi:hypothetical protein
MFLRTVVGTGRCANEPSARRNRSTEQIEILTH